jgi:small-conductance mechanosensitive channel
MSVNELLLSLRNVLELRLFTIGNNEITVSIVIIMLLIVLASYGISKIGQRTVASVIAARGGKAGTIGTVTGFLHYVILIVGFAIALQTAGIDLTTLFAAGAIFAVGLGFAMQSIAESFVAGVILLAERSIKPGDILEVDGRVVRVREMGIRSVVGRTRDGEEMIIPNSILMTSIVKNYTLRDSTYRMRVPVGVVYGSDMARVREVLERVADSVSRRWGVVDSKPLVEMADFGDNAVRYDVLIWMPDPWEMRRANSEVHEAIWLALREAGITIAFPQLDVHFDSPVMDSVRRLADNVA